MWREAWEDVTVSVERIEEVEDGIVALLTFVGKGRGSGVEVSLRVGQVATVSNRGFETRVHPGLDEALEAVGLTE